MMDLKNIFKQEESSRQEQMLKYLRGELGNEERHAFEKAMADDPFVNEAVEGLQEFNDPLKVNLFADQLNKQLQKQIAKKSKRKFKRRLREQNWLVIAILAILLLCVIGYLLVHFYTTGH